MKRDKTIRKADLIRMTARISGTKMIDAGVIVNALFASLRHFMMDLKPPAKIVISEFGIFDLDVKKSYTTSVLAGQKGERMSVIFPDQIRIRFRPTAAVADYFKKALIGPGDSLATISDLKAEEPLSDEEEENLSPDEPETILVPVFKPLSPDPVDGQDLVPESPRDDVDAQMTFEPETPSERESDYF